MGFINFQSITIQLCMRNFSVKQFQTIIETIENKKYKSINYCLKLLIEIIDRSILLSSPSLNPIKINQGKTGSKSRRTKMNGVFSVSKF